MVWFNCVLFFLVIYGMSYIITNGVGPFYIFMYIRKMAERVGDNFGMLFKCMLCMPTNLGIVFSLLDWFLIKDVAITPFNIILGNTDLWWLSALFDGCAAAGVSYFIYNMNEYLENANTSFEEDITDEVEK